MFNLYYYVYSIYLNAEEKKRIVTMVVNYCRTKNVFEKKLYKNFVSKFLLE